MRFSPTIPILLICLGLIIQVQAQDGKNPEFPGQKDSLYLLIDSSGHLFVPMNAGSQLAVHFLKNSTHGILRDEEVATDVLPTYSSGPKRLLKIRKEQLQSTSFLQGMKSFPMYYRVKQGETLFRIARVYLDISILDLMDMNDLDSTSLSIDQVLFVGYLHLPSANTMAENPATLEKTHTSESGYLRPLTFSSQKMEIDSTVKHLKQSRGVAFWDKKQSMPGGLLAMHPTARINSLIEIHNPMLERTVKAKVIGHIPEDRYPADINIIVSPEVAHQLGVLDSRFHVILRYEE